MIYSITGLLRGRWAAGGRARRAGRRRRPQAAKPPKPSAGRFALRAEPALCSE